MNKRFSTNRLEQILFFLTVFLLPTQLGKHFWPEFGSIFSIRTDYFSPTVYVWDLVLAGLLVVFLVQGKRFKSTPLFLLLFFCLSQLGSLFLAGNIGAGLVRLEQYVLTGLFGIYLASQSFSFIKKALYFGILGSVLYSSLIAILQVLKGGTLGLWILGERNFSLDTISIATFDWYGQVYLRAYATFPHPNVLAAFLLISVGLFIFLRQKGVQFGSKGFEWLVLSLGSVGVVLTFSRVGLLFYSVIFGYLLRSRMKIFGLIIIFLLPFLYVRFNSAFNFDQLSFIRREELAIQAVDLFYQQPLFGVGLNNFIYELAYGGLVSGENRFLQPVHTIYLLTLAETGVVGLFGLAVLVGVPFYWVLRRKNYLLVFIWTAILGMGFFDHYFLTLAQGQRLLFLVWGISMLEYGDERGVKKSRRSNRLAIGR